MKFTECENLNELMPQMADWKTFDKYVETILSDTHANQVNGINNNEIAEFFDNVFSKYENKSAHGWHFITDSNGFHTMVSDNYLEKFRYGINTALNESYGLNQENEWKYKYKGKIVSNASLCGLLESFSLHYENDNEKEFYTSVKNSGYWDHDFCPWVKNENESHSIQILD